MYENLPLPEADEAQPDEPVQRDPYDGVALGVECAWPAEFHL